MAEDIEQGPYDSSPTEPSARLCNFPTGTSNLTVLHQQWLRRNVVPVLRSNKFSYVHIAGLASRAGASTKNDKLALARADAVIAFLEGELNMSLQNADTGSYGEGLSGGKTKDNDGFYRAVMLTVSARGYQPPPPPPPRTNIWLGIGGKFGGGLIGGYDDAEIAMVSMDDPSEWFWMKVSTWRLGLAAGASGTVVLGVVTGVSNPRKQVDGVKLSDWDYQISIGGRWKTVVGTLAKLPAVVKVAKAVKAGNRMKKAATVFGKGEWEKFATTLKSAFAEMGVNTTPNKPEVYVIDLPAGGGVEVGVYWGWGDVVVR